MIFEMLIVGVIVGIIMGLTGAGGALVAIPLFMHFFEMTLKEASIYSLIAVFIASLSNFYNQRKNGDLKLAIVLVAFSAIGSLISQPFKHLLPDIAMAGLLAIISLYSLYAIWLPSKKVNSADDLKLHWSLNIFVGVTLGVLATFTGLGGGVLMLPVLLNIYRYEQDKAVATSLIVVGLSSLISFSIQVSKSKEIHISLDIIALILSILMTSYLLKMMASRVSMAHLKTIRRVVFSLVVVTAFVKIFH